MSQPSLFPAKGDHVRVRLWTGERATGHVTGAGTSLVWVEIDAGPEWALDRAPASYRIEDVEVVG